MANNAQHFCMCPSGPVKTPEGQSALSNYKAAVLKDYRWEPGASISIRFLEGDSSLQERVCDVANTWTDVANLNFDFVDEGPTMKRFRPRAQGRAFRIEKRTSHVTVVLASGDDLPQRKSRKGNR